MKHKHQKCARCGRAYRGGPASQVCPECRHGMPARFRRMYALPPPHCPDCGGRCRAGRGEGEVWICRKCGQQVRRLVAGV